MMFLTYYKIHKTSAAATTPTSKSHQMSDPYYVTNLFSQAIKKEDNNTTNDEKDFSLTSLFHDICIGNENIGNRRTITHNAQAQAYRYNLERSREIRKQLVEERLRCHQDNRHNDLLRLNTDIVVGSEFLRYQERCDIIESDGDSDDDNCEHDNDEEGIELLLKERKKVQRPFSGGKCSKSASNVIREIDLNHLRRMDVLLHRGQFSHKRPGNIFYHEQILSMKDEYDSASKKEKTEITWKIYKTILNKGGRFLFKKKEGVFYEAVSSKVRRKIAQCFRDSKRVKKR